MSYQLLAAIAFAGVVVAGLWAASSRLPRLDIHTEIIIDANPAVVWAVLADGRSYAEWNPYHVRVDGEFFIGETLKVEIHKPDGRVVFIEPRILEVEPRRVLTWGGGFPALFIGVHVFELHPEDNGRTRLVQRETFDGLAVSIVPLDGIEDGYNRMNAALKEFVERKTQEQKSGWEISLGREAAGGTRPSLVPPA